MSLMEPDFLFSLLGAQKASKSTEATVESLFWWLKKYVFTQFQPFLFGMMIPNAQILFCW
jgi:hypothetical protein